MNSGVVWRLADVDFSVFLFLAVLSVIVLVIQVIVMPDLFPGLYESKKRRPLHRLWRWCPCGACARRRRADQIDEMNP